MKRPKDLSYAKWLCQYYLSYRMLTRWELEQKLKRKEVPAEFIEEALNWCEQEGYIDDLDFAERFIKDAVNLKQKGKQRIKQELYTKKIPSNIIEEAFGETDMNFNEALALAIEKKAGRLDLEDRKDRDRLIGYLSRRGFNIGEIIGEIDRRRKNG